MTALIDTDWYPASYPWHCVIELSPDQKRIVIKKGDPICRVIPVRRDTYFATEMSPAGFDEFFARPEMAGDAREIRAPGKYGHHAHVCPSAGAKPVRRDDLNSDSDYNTVDLGLGAT